MIVNMTMLIPLLTLTLTTDAGGEPPAARPDLVFILSDDHRSDFLSCAGHPFLQTPHIDALAAHGVRFENAFVTTSICAASRATILTGLYERTHGFTFGTPPIAAADAADSYPARLKAAGYRTGFVGKWGVAVEGGLSMRGQGDASALFDVIEMLGRNPYFKPQPDGSLRHVTDLAGDACVRFISGTPADRPLCLSLSFNAAHAEDSDHDRQYPYPFAEAGLYAGADVPPPVVQTDFWKDLPAFFHDSMHRTRYGWRWDTPEKYEANYRNYCRLLTGMDRNVGRVVEALEVSGRLPNTVVIFLGDNGYYAGSRGFAGKWSHYDESLRVPLIVCDFRAQSQGRVSDAVALNLDITPTLLAYAGVTAPERYQGGSLRRLVEQTDVEPLRQEFFIEHRMDRFDIPKYEGLRGPRLKYARYYEQPAEVAEFLHDLTADPKELENLARDPQYADELADLRRRTDEWSDRLHVAHRRSHREPASP